MKQQIIGMALNGSGVRVSFVPCGSVRSLLRTGAPWRDVPERYGPWRTVASRFYRWCRAGIPT